MPQVVVRKKEYIMHLILNGIDKGYIVEWHRESASKRYMFYLADLSYIYINEFDILSISSTGNMIITCVDFEQH